MGPPIPGRGALGYGICFSLTDVSTAHFGMEISLDNHQSHAVGASGLKHILVIYILIPGHVYLCNKCSDLKKNISQKVHSIGFSSTVVSTEHFG